MTLTPLLEASVYIQAHTYAAVIAVVIGAVQLLRQKGDATHRLLGRIWVGLLAVVAFSSFWVKELMPGSAIFGFSPIHILSVVSLCTIAGSFYALRRGLISAHARSMTSLYFMGLITAGVFTFLPGRILHKVVFGI